MLLRTSINFSYQQSLIWFWASRREQASEQVLYFSLFSLFNWQLVAANAVQQVSAFFNFGMVAFTVFAIVRLVSQGLAQVGLAEVDAAASDTLSHLDPTVRLQTVIMDGCHCDLLRLVALTCPLRAQLLLHVVQVDLVGPHLVVQSPHRSPLRHFLLTCLFTPKHETR